MERVRERVGGEAEFCQGKRNHIWNVYDMHDSIDDI